ncbi:Copper homeostasis protein cutC-like protein [Frankliniella fusca]|uniref:Copper homeostasis protein cutC homolog n=1 Tax=Frankliniella fusca TaxID=407009 RepID=A0AAE1HHB8_9NEOP|nr:Copper homeostasis protein cutC-like protein [Frankliniella fusca]
MEVCVDSVESAVNAVEGGAARLELCSSLSEGGLTPTPGLLRAVSTAINEAVPIFCMLRVRGGNDFVYSKEEVEAMKFDAIVLKDSGKVDGFVFGALTPSGDLDVDACHTILQVTNPLPVTFHRAIDVCRDPLLAVSIAADLGFKRILTSGQEESALKGVNLIKKMVEEADGQISIMVGAGVTKDNIAFILEQTGAKEYHGSARSSVKPTVDSNKLCMGKISPVTDPEQVAQTIRAAEKVLSQ